MSTSVSHLRSDLIALVDQVQAHTGLSDVKISRLATEQNYRLIATLRTGRNVTLNSLERLETWLRGALDVINGPPEAYAAWMEQAAEYVKLRGAKPGHAGRQSPRPTKSRARQSGKKRAG